MLNQNDIMRRNDIIMAKGMDALIDALGHVEAEEFIYTIKRECFDYSEWRHDYFKDMTLDEFLNEAAKDAEQHPYKGSGKIL